MPSLSALVTMIETNITVGGDFLLVYLTVGLEVIDRVYLICKVVGSAVSGE